MRRSQQRANQAFYAAHREAEIQRVRARQAATVKLLRDLRATPCADCRGEFDPWQMDFDHRDASTKAFRLTAGRAMLKPSNVLIAEAAKCDIVCANCHRVRTRERHAKRLAAARPVGRSPGLAQRRNRWRDHARLLDRLREVPCADCRLSFPPCAMDFDHRDSAAKSTGVTRLIGRAGVKRILAEAAKCDIVCANCHRSRTLRRREQAIHERE